ncbi:hypothetical protein PQJ75_00870 [Rhodoplanes sp. TEM]|uniref:Ribbon-helix-helix protein CopG domain-containing protein n=1 Tax=Rhodoplanes tepidamans TaxID=200616 RepID=A0ABT5J702_RHOTP|nr:MULTISPECIES: hypothetical protein [Rhodoplanes]MDC7784805.1 hypothetical protein [Rhodoplanes tepidamans]MDC7982272.1 hypothetical protein [Rhodoplanes sp. TEM]MDQ0356279.1 hypothetical protein [Rhodoplanes tepidamans]
MSQGGRTPKTPRPEEWWRSELEKARDAGDSMPAAAARLGVTLTEVKYRASRYGISFAGHALAEKGVLVLQAHPDVLRMLSDEGRRRGMSRRQIATKILDTVARDDLYAAVLDTGDEGDGDALP